MRMGSRWVLLLWLILLKKMVLWLGLLKKMNYSGSFMLAEC